MPRQRAKRYVETPRGHIIRTKTGSSRLYWNKNFVPQRNKEFTKAQKVVDTLCIRLMDPLTPFKFGILKKSVVLGSFIGSGELHQLAPYSRKLYYNPGFNFVGGPIRGAFWFERMKNSNKDYIYKKASKEFE